MVLRCVSSLRHARCLDDELVTRLGLDIGQGLAYYVITAVGVMTVLFTMITLATAACIMTRTTPC